MSNPARILERLRRNPPELSRSELHTLLKALGWTIEPGNHDIARTPTGKTFSIPSKSGRMVKRKYLKDLLKEIERSGGI